MRTGFLRHDHRGRVHRPIKRPNPEFAPIQRSQRKIPLQRGNPRLRNNRTRDAFCLSCDIHPAWKMSCGCGQVNITEKTEKNRENSSPKRENLERMDGKCYLKRVAFSGRGWYDIIRKSIRGSMPFFRGYSSECIFLQGMVHVQRAETADVLSRRGRCPHRPAGRAARFQLPGNRAAVCKGRC